jgi:hypothetical protein
VSAAGGDVWVQVSERVSSMERRLDQLLNAIKAADTKHQNGAEANEKGNETY